MNGWAGDELDRIGGADELGIASRRPDGTVRPFVTIWAVRLGDDLFVRSAYGSDNPWYRRAVASGEGRVRAAGVERDVTFEPVDRALDDALHAAYEAKYARYGRGIVKTVMSPESAMATLRVVPR